MFYTKISSKFSPFFYYIKIKKYIDLFQISVILKEESTFSAMTPHFQTVQRKGISMNKISNISNSSAQPQVKSKNVYGYIRVSTETQADKGYGLNIQEDAIKEYCLTHNLNLIKIFIDAGKSGTIGDKDNLDNRPAITELLYTLNGTKTIIVMNTSRLWRDDGARALVSMAVRKSNGEIISIEQPRYSLYSDNPQDFLFNSMMEMLDQYERMVINKRLTKGKNEKAKQGYKPAGRAPLGYQWNKETRKIEVNEQDAVIVKNIFFIAKMGLSPTYIAKLMNEKKMFGKSGKAWSKQSIQVVLRNKFYTGILVHQGQEIEGQHTPIIDKELFNYVQTCRKTGKKDLDEVFNECS